MVNGMNQPKAINNVTVEDLTAHRWCYYQNDDEDCNCFEHVIPDTHPEFSSHIEELELVEFEFENGATCYGVFDGSESYSIILEDRWQSFWFGVAKPNEEDVKELSNYLESSDFKLPVKAKTKWSGKEAVFNGIKYINKNGDVCEVVI